MNPRVVTAVCIFLAATLTVARAGEYDSYPETYQETYPETYPETAYSDEKYEEKPKRGAKKPYNETGYGKKSRNKTSDIAPHDGDTDAANHRGYCHWAVGTWYKPEAQVRCSCMQCTCQQGGEWKCDYNFAFCPYYYCGNHIYNPLTSVCCCGKIYSKKADYNCCGYYYFYSKTSKCCNYYSVRPMHSQCPRDKVQ